MDNFAGRAINFYSGLEIGEPLPDGIQVLNPYSEKHVMENVEEFFRKFCSDNHERVVLLGINPGRFGAGVTGITFTDPVALKENCGIDNHLDQRTELSSRFVYEVIDAFGGPARFYSMFFLSAVSPLGFVRSGRNLNYYDDRALEESLRGFISGTLKAQVNLGIRTDKAVCLGEGKNYRFLEKLNRETGMFGEIIPLPHPRWVMQYRFKKRAQYIGQYLDVLNDCRSGLQQT